MNQKKKIIFIVNKLRVGGAENIIVSAANLIDKNKYDVYVGFLFATKRQGNFYEKIKLANEKKIDFGFQELFHRLVYFEYINF